MPMNSEAISFTADETEKLTASVRKGTAAIVELWDTLKEIEERMGLDWEPTRGLAVCDILEYFASGLNGPETAQDIIPSAVVEAFSNSGDWCEVTNK
jgi:hypothetical protein